MSYTPPPGGSVSLVFSSSLYTKPPGSSVSLEFVPAAGATAIPQTIGDSAEFGTPRIWLFQQYVNLNTSSNGITPPGGFNTINVDFHRLRPASIDDALSVFGTAYIYLGQQFVTVPAGIDATPVLSDTAVVYHQRDVEYYPSDRPNAASLQLEFNRLCYPAWPQDGSNLHLEFAWPYIKAYGWCSTSFGTAAVTYSNIANILPSGLAAGALGTTVVTAGPVTAAPASLTGAAYGSATVFNSQQFLVPTGFTGAAYGTATVANLNRSLTLAGFTSGAYGTASVVTTPELKPTGIASAAYGTAAVALFTRYLVMTGFAPSAFGSASVVNRNRTVTTDLWDASAFGIAQIYNHTQYIYPSGGDIDFGTADVDYFNRTRAMTGWDSSSVSYLAEVDHYGTLRPHSMFTPVWGTAEVTNGLTHILLPATINYPSWNIGLSGTSVTNLNRELKPSGFAGAFGRPQMSPIYLFPNGLTASFGVADIENWIRYLEPVAWDSSDVWNDYGPVDPDTGRGAGVYRTFDPILPVGLAAGAFGAAGIALYTRGIEINDAIAPGVAGVPRVSAVNYLVPDGIDSLVVGNVDKWEAGKIKPYGPDMSSYGTPRIDRRMYVVSIDPIAIPWPHMGVPVYPSGIAPLTIAPPVLVAPYDCNFRNVANATIPSSTGFGTASVS